jgi:hypothetical protein
MVMIGLMMDINKFGLLFCCCTCSVAQAKIVNCIGTENKKNKKKHIIPILPTSLATIICGSIVNQSIMIKPILVLLAVLT